MQRPPHSFDGGSGRPRPHGGGSGQSGDGGAPPSQTNHLSEYDDAGYGHHHGSPEWQRQQQRGPDRPEDHSLASTYGGGEQLSDFYSHYGPSQYGEGHARPSSSYYYSGFESSNSSHHALDYYGRSENSSHHLDYYGLSNASGGGSWDDSRSTRMRDRPHSSSSADDGPGGPREDTPSSSTVEAILPGDATGDGDGACTRNGVCAQPWAKVSLSTRIFLHPSKAPVSYCTQHLITSMHSP